MVWINLIVVSKACVRVNFQVTLLEIKISSVWFCKDGCDVVSNGKPKEGRVHLKCWDDDIGYMRLCKMRSKALRTAKVQFYGASGMVLLE